jgi:hypothetical protein
MIGFDCNLAFASTACGRRSFTKHAHKRLQQRAIPQMVVGLLHQYGSAFRSDGADIIVFDKAAKTRLRRAFGGPRGLKAIENWLDVYLVFSDEGTLVTAGHRHSRIYR